MTQKGIEVASDLNLNDIIINHWDFISSLLNKVLNKDCNPYDIQIESFKIGEKYQEYVNDSELKIVKNHAFKSGYNLESYNLLFGIVIRDKYLSSKGLKSSDVDLYDPNIK
jgi:hypothetical protein